PAAIEAETFSVLEQHRLAAARHRRRSLLVGLPVLLAAAALLYGYSQGQGHAVNQSALRVALLLAFGGFAVSTAANAGFWLFGRVAKHRVLSVLAAQHGLEYRIAGVPKHEADPFEAQGLFGYRSNGGSTEDAFSGVIDGVDFQLFETLRMHYNKGFNGGGTQVFHGLCLSLSFPKRFSGTTRVLGDSDAASKKLDETAPDLSLERVRLEDTTFEALFEVVSSDQVEARYLLTPSLMERLVDLQKVLGPRTRLRAAFHDRHLLVTLSQRKSRRMRAKIFAGKLDKLHHFEIKDAHRPVEEMDLIRQFERELEVIKALITTLDINMKTRV
ncbi:MAG: DUF3137 domain-containing protein, partial [Acidobacteriota bacterium]